MCRNMCECRKGPPEGQQRRPRVSIWGAGGAWLCSDHHESPRGNPCPKINQACPGALWLRGRQRLSRSPGSWKGWSPVESPGSGSPGGCARAAMAPGGHLCTPSGKQACEGHSVQVGGGGGHRLGEVSSESSCFSEKQEPPPSAETGSAGKGRKVENQDFLCAVTSPRGALSFRN